MITASLLAQFSMLDTVLFALRIVTAVGAMLVGYLLTGPLVRVLVRLAVHKPLPKWTVRMFRGMGGILAGLLVYLYLPVGLGTGGWGFGPGKGGNAGLGPGPGALAKGTNDGNQTSKKGEGPGEKIGPTKETLTVEMLGGKRYPGEDRYYLLHRKEPAVAFSDVETYIKSNRERLDKVQIWFTPESVSDLHGAVLRLQGLARDHDLRVSLELPKLP